MNIIEYYVSTSSHSKDQTQIIIILIYT